MTSYRTVLKFSLSHIIVQIFDEKNGTSHFCSPPLESLGSTYTVHFHCSLESA